MDVGVSSAPFEGFSTLVKTQIIHDGEKERDRERLGTTREFVTQKMNDLRNQRETFFHQILHSSLCVVEDTEVDLDRNTH